MDNNNSSKLLKEFVSQTMKDYFEKLVYKCKMLRALLTRSTEAKKIFGEMIIPPPRVIATFGSWSN